MISTMKANQGKFVDAIALIEKFSPAPMILAKAMQLLRDPLAVRVVAAGLD